MQLKWCLHIIWLITPFMGSTVHQPSHIQDPCPTEHGGYEPGISPCFAPEVDWNDSWQNEAQDGHQNHVVAVRINEKKNIIFFHEIQFRLKICKSWIGSWAAMKTYVELIYWRIRWYLFLFCIEHFSRPNIGNSACQKRNYQLQYYYIGEAYHILFELDPSGNNVSMLLNDVIPKILRECAMMKRRNYHYYYHYLMST